MSCSGETRTISGIVLQEREAGQKEEEMEAACNGSEEHYFGAEWNDKRVHICRESRKARNRERERERKRETHVKISAKLMTVHIHGSETYRADVTKCSMYAIPAAFSTAPAMIEKTAAT